MWRQWVKKRFYKSRLPKYLLVTTGCGVLSSCGYFCFFVNFFKCFIHFYVIWFKCSIVSFLETNLRLVIFDFTFIYVTTQKHHVFMTVGLKRLCTLGITRLTLSTVLFAYFKLSNLLKNWIWCTSTNERLLDLSMIPARWLLDEQWTFICFKHLSWSYELDTKE